MRAANALSFLQSARASRKALAVDRPRSETLPPFQPPGRYDLDGWVSRGFTPGSVPLPLRGNLQHHFSLPLRISLALCWRGTERCTNVCLIQRPADLGVGEKRNHFRICKYTKQIAPLHRLHDCGIPLEIQNPRVLADAADHRRFR